MAIEDQIDDMIDALIARVHPKAKSLIVSLLGDAILPHGGRIWLGSLVDLMEPFGCGERVVRTSVFRLTKEGWLVSKQVGRRSFYSLTDSGRRRFETAHRIIYAAAKKPWAGRWTIVFTGLVVDGEMRASLRDDLAWQGYGQLLPGVMLHPESHEASLRQALAEAGLSERAVVMQASGDGWMKLEGLHDIVARAWNLDKLAAIYSSFLTDFRPFVPMLNGNEINPRAAFRLRILLIHAWRRAILRDPLLPEELLPGDWPGVQARLLCRNLYRGIQSAAEAHLAQTMTTADGPIGEPNPSYFERFGGLALSQNV